MPNRLADETSPYLLQHAGNPVDWYPWSAEALARARAEDRPILLSIGYAACHWCHVMAHECFEDPGIAARMNRDFVNVKVDREERPDLDQFYQAAAQALGSGGGWPLTAFLLPDGRPFFAGTYFPPADRPGLAGLPTVLEAVARAWREQRPRLEAVARQVTEAVIRAGAPAAPARPAGEAGAALPSPGAASPLVRGTRALLARADPDRGGFGTAPKFPSAPSLELLRLAVLRLPGERLGEEAGAHLALTLGRMARGGIYDQVGGGFHRYSVDARWGVPHFEKMLYDNALLLPLYAEEHRRTGDPLLARVARETAAYLLRDLAAPEGGFYASEDADSPAPGSGRAEEGRFYTWTPAELGEALGAEEAAFAAACLGVTEDGNFEDGRSVLRLALAPEQAGERFGLAPGEAAARLEAARRRLLEARGARPRPARDEKVIAAWNGLAVSGLARAGRALDEPAWIEAASSAAAFILGTLRGPDGTLRRSWRGRPAPVAGFLEDHAYVAQGLLDLHEAAPSPRWLEEALRLGEVLLERFFAAEAGWFRVAPFAAGGTRPAGATDAGDPAPPAPVPLWADAHDASLPAAGAVAVGVLLRLHARAAEARFRSAAEAALASRRAELERLPHAAPTLVRAWDLAVHGP